MSTSCPVAIMEGLLCIPSCAHELLSDKSGDSRTAYTVAAVFKRVSGYQYICPSEDMFSHSYVLCSGQYVVACVYE